MKLTKSMVDKIKPPVTGQAFHRDSQLTGFALRITANGVKSFVVEKRVNGKVRRATIGRYPAVTAEKARKTAQKQLGEMAYGKDPVKVAQDKQVQSITLQQAFDDYLKSRKTLKAYTKINYYRALNQVVPDWFDKPLVSISKEMIIQRHTQHGETRSQARANLAMRTLRAIFNYAINRYENSDGSKIIQENPVLQLSRTRAWYKIQRRDTVVKKHELAIWYQGLDKLISTYPDDTRYPLLKDYLLLVLFTGLRRGEAASLTWKQIDFVERTLIVTDTKNGKKHTLPLADFLYELLQQRKQQQQVQSPNDFVFPANNQSGHIENFRKWLLKAEQASGIHFTIHDLRRTFITIAESLDISVYALKRLLNHATANDVTASYIILDVERLREPMQKITDHILSLLLNSSQNIGYGKASISKKTVETMG